MDKFQEVLNRLDLANVVCYDAETSGLDWKRQHIVGHVLTFGPAPQDSYYLPVRHAGGGNLFDNPGPQTADGWDRVVPDFERALINKLDRQGLLVFGHHLSFDLKMLSTVGFTMRPHFEDTYINAPLLDEWQSGFSLEVCAQLAGVAPKLKGQIDEYIQRLFPDLCTVGARGERAPMAHFWRLRGNDPTAVAYAAGDGTTTWQLRDWQGIRLREQDLLRVHAIESKLIPILARMTLRGIRIDEGRLHWLKGHLDTEIERLMAGFPSGFNVRSPADVQKWCQDSGHTDWPLTEKKQAPSFPEIWLETHAPGKAIIAVRKLQTLRSTFIEPMINEHLFNGRVHTEYHQLRGDEYGTITGRLSSSGPNLHAVSKRNKDIGKLHRSIFVPEEGCLWGEADFRQAEPRLLAYYADCKVLLDDYRDNPDADAHAAVTRAMNPDWESLTKEEFKDRRETGKRINQTLITGGGKGVLVSKYKVPADKVDEYWDAYFAGLPEVRQLQIRAGRTMKIRGYVKSLLGRRARLKDLNKSYVAVNRLLQLGNADVLKLKIVQIDEYLESVGRPIDLINNIHDSLSFSFSPEQRSILTEALRIMVDFSPGQAIELPVPMAVDFGEGQSWSEATYGAN